jgi:hypothetical protein
MTTAMLTKEQAFDLSKSIGKRGQALNRDIQKIACTAIGYANIHGDITVAQNIFENLRDNKGIRVNSFVRYLETFGQLQYDKESKNFIYRKRDDVIKDVMELFLTLADNPWYQAIKQETPESVYDVAEMVKKLIARVEKLNENERNTVQNIELLETLKAITSDDVEVELKVAA